MSATLERLRSAIHAIEAHRAAIGDATADLALAPLRAQLARLQGGPAPGQQLRQVSGWCAATSTWRRSPRWR